MSKTIEKTIQEYSDYVDPDTGEVYTSSKQTIQTTRVYSSQDEFIQVYLNDLSGLLNIASKTELQMLMILWKYSSYNESEENKGNFVIINTKVLQDISTKLNVKIQSVRNCLSSLVKNDKKPLIKDSRFRSTYYLNPVYFFKGALKDRPKAVEYVLRYVDCNKTNEFE
jgi:hypothetical protein